VAIDDDRFAKMVGDEFGVHVSSPGAAEDKLHKTAAKAAKKSRRGRKPEPEWFSFDAAMDQAEPEYDPWDQFQAPTPPPLRRPRSPLVIGGLAAFMAAIAIAVMWIAGVAMPTWVRGIGGLLIGVGLACLLLALPRHRTREAFDDGAVL